MARGKWDQWNRTVNLQWQADHLHKPRRKSGRRGPSFATVLKRAAAAERRVQRQSLQRHRALVKQQAQIAKMQERERAAYEVQVFENRLEMLTSVHQECAEICDWEAVAQEPSPSLPIKTNTHEQAAQDKMNQYRPGFFDRLFRQEEKRRRILQQQVQLASQQDETEYQEALEDYRQDEERWRQQREQANLVLRGEWQAFLDVVSEAQPFSDVEDLGSHIELARGKRGEVLVTLHINSNRVIPSEVKSLLKSGKLSIKKMPQGRFNDLYQDYVCGCIFRVARELFALLPIKIVVIHCYGDHFNSATGRTSNECLVSTAIRRDEIAYLNFDALDPSDALETLVHNMKFRKTQGFAPVKPLGSTDY